MKSNEKSYEEYLQEKYLTGRNLFLNTFVYPRYIKEFNEGIIWDLGCGMGDFLRYCKKIKRKAFGIDSNPFFIELCKKKGIEVFLDDVTTLANISDPIDNAICDNVLEHLELNEINDFFKKIKQKMKVRGVLLVVVPGEKGFARDPTHKTFVDYEVIEYFQKMYAFSQKKIFYHPFNIKRISKYLYLNMCVIKLTF